MGELFATCNCRRAQLNEAETVRFGYYRTNEENQRESRSQRARDDASGGPVAKWSV